MSRIPAPDEPLDERRWQALMQWLYARLPMYQRQGAAAFKKDLTNIRALMALLDQPHTRFRAIHVAGTNGKGSVSHMLAAIFQQMGLRTGLYTSPHLVDFRERIRVDGQPVPRAWVRDFVWRHQAAFAKIRPSFFEITVAMAFRFFAERQVDMAVIETGLGGRLDSTNVIEPELAVITHIGLDHQQFLGDTLAQIAAEKAGIIKARRPVIVGQRHPDTAGVFCRKAEALQAPLTFVEDEFRVRFRKMEGIGQVVDVWRRSGAGWQLWLPELYLDLGGRYQLANLATALAACSRWAAQREIPLDTELLRAALGSVRTRTGLRGRWEVLGHKPLIVGDVAHNADGLAQVLPQVLAQPHRRLHVVMGVVNDKKLDEVLPLFPKTAHYFFARPDIPRGLEAEALRGMAARRGLDGAAWPSVVEAFEAAKRAAHPEDLIFVGGSTFVLAEILAYLERKRETGEPKEG